MGCYSPTVGSRLMMASVVDVIVNKLF